MRMKVPSEAEMREVLEQRNELREEAASPEV
jgi:hypothetical protein